MRQQFLIATSFMFFGFIPKQQIDPITVQQSDKVVHVTQFDDIYVSFDYLTDSQGYNYGAVFYLYNPMDTDVSIYWQFTGSQNVNFGPASSDRTIIPAKTKVWISTVTSADHSKPWNSGKVQWKY